MLSTWVQRRQDTAVQVSAVLIAWRQPPGHRNRVSKGACGSSTMLNMFLPKRFLGIIDNKIFCCAQHKKGQSMQFHVFFQYCAVNIQCNFSFTTFFFLSLAPAQLPLHNTRPTSEATVLSGQQLLMTKCRGTVTQTIHLTELIQNSSDSSRTSCLSVSLKISLLCH